MRKLPLILLAWLAFIAPARAVSLLPTTPITTAAAGQVGPVLQYRIRPGAALPSSASVQWTVVYGSGGTTYAMWLQTSFDGGTTWCDVATASGTTAALHSAQNISFTATVAITACTDGAGAGLAVFGSQWRVKYTTTGTYATTSLRVDVNLPLTSFP